MNAPAQIGAARERVEDARFLAGTGAFVDDLDRPGLLHAAVLRSPLAHGRVAGIHAEEALAMPGVHAVFTAADLDAVPEIPIRLAPIEGLARFLQPVIARERVRYVGEPLALVVADSRALAEDALERIELDIAPLDPVAGPEAAESDAVLLFPEHATNVAARYAVARGEPDAAFAEAEYTRKETFRCQRQTALPMETRGLLAEWDGEAARLVVSGAAKVAFFNRRALAAMLGLDEGAIDLVEVDVGGGFGVRGEFYPEDFLVPFAARRLGRPIKWIEDRREHLAATNHSRDLTCELEIACRRDGTILGLRGRLVSDQGAYIRTNGGVVPAKAAQFVPGPYRIPAFAMEVTALVTNKTPVGTYRGPGRFAAHFFRERLIDMAARDLGLDPAAMRARNLVAETEMPYSIGSLVPYEGESAYDTGDYHAVLKRALAEIGWAERAGEQGAWRGGRLHGVGLACFVESGGAGPRENVRFALEAGGRVGLYVGSSVLGQGLETVFAQIAADALDLDFDLFDVRHGSTAHVREGFGTYHSRAVVMGGSAILDAARAFTPRLAEAAGRMLARNTHGEIRLSGRHALAPDGARVGLEDLARWLAERGESLEAEGTFANETRTYSYGTHAAHVSVDPRTGHVRVEDYVAVEDVGRAINPMLVHGQAIGAVVQGLGGVFLDHLLYDEEGQLLNASLADYLVPTASDFPRVRAVTLELRPSPSNPLGAKGAGEGGIVAVAGAVANAVAAALTPHGVEPTELPLSPPRVWALIEAARSRPPAGT